MKKNLIILVKGLLIFIATTTANSSNNKLDLNQIKIEIIDYLQEILQEEQEGRLVLKLKSLDKRLYAKTCEYPLEYNLQKKLTYNQNLTMEIDCPKPQWRVYLPVNLKIFKPIVVTTRAISRNQLITMHDISLQERNVSSLNQDYISDPKELVGKVVKFAIQANTVIKPKFVSKPKIINRGDNVSIIVKQQNLLVQMRGIAIEPGALGDHIKIKNVSSKKIIEATVIASGKVQIFM